MGRLERSWQLLAALTAGIVSAVLMPDAFYGDAVSEAVTVLGFLMAAFVPAMALAATSIRAGNLSVRRVRSLGNAVQVQIKVFGGLFFYSLAACVILVAGKLLHWWLPAIPLGVGGWAAIHTASLFPGFLTFLFIFLILRTGTFVTGMISILRLTVSVAEDEARLRDAAEEIGATAELDAYEMPPNYGKVLES